VTGNGREPGGSFALGPWQVRPAGYGAMPLAGDGVLALCSPTRASPERSYGLYPLIGCHRKKTGGGISE
jgi:hypothetical protein